jgi:hypothetical protein
MFQALSVNMPEMIDEEIFRPEKVALEADQRLKFNPLSPGLR